MKKPLYKPRPGGSYIRDKDTGAVRRVDETSPPPAAAEARKPATPQTSPAADSGPAPKKGK